MARELPYKFSAPGIQESRLQRVERLLILLSQLVERITLLLLTQEMSTTEREKLRTLRFELMVVLDASRQKSEDEHILLLEQMTAFIEGLRDLLREEGRK